MKAAIYARVSTSDQEPENQLIELRRYVAARGWQPVEFIDTASGMKETPRRSTASRRPRRGVSLTSWWSGGSTR